MERIITQRWKSPMGELILGSYGTNLVLCDWYYRKRRAAIDKRIQINLKTQYEQGTSPIISSTLDQLRDYFSGERQRFEIGLYFAGSEFQQRVWEELCKIPYGQTETYMGLARKIGNTAAIRAVAGANGDNALSIFVPCHRIIGSNGDLTGYAGGLEVKKKLLELEGALQESQMELF